MNWYLKVLGQYAEFNGRARRTEFWMFTLFNAIFAVAAGLVGQMLGSGAIAKIYSFALFVPSLAVAVRRLQDIGKSGWMLLVGLIPVIGWIWLIVLYIQEGDQGLNQYGFNPKEAAY